MIIKISNEQPVDGEELVDCAYVMACNVMNTSQEELLIQSPIVWIYGSASINNE